MSMASVAKRRDFRGGSPEAKKVIDFLVKEMKVTKIRFPAFSAMYIMMAPDSKITIGLPPPFGS
mgnify:CR=1 FL=1